MRNGSKQRARRAHLVTGNKILWEYENVAIGDNQFRMLPKHRVLVGKDGKLIRRLRRER